MLDQVKQYEAYSACYLVTGCTLVLCIYCLFYVDEIVGRLRELRPSIVLVTPAHLDVVTMCCGRDPRVRVMYHLFIWM